MLGSPNIATAPASSPQPVQPESSSGGAINFLVLLVVAGVIWLAVKFFKKREERAQRVHALNAMRKWAEPMLAEFPFWFISALQILCMDREGERLRFISYDSDGMKKDDLTVPVANIVSVEMSGGDEVVTEYETTSTKPDALAAALVGGLLFGRTGAIVGATAAGSEAQTVAKQRVVNRPSVLVFELSDLANPVMRFSSMDHAQCDLWLHRVRSAMAKQKGHTVAEGGSLSGRLVPPSPETSSKGLTTAQLRAIGG
jgi:hypothetical protein